MVDKLDFEFEGKRYFIKPLTSDAISKGHKVYNKAFKKAIEDGSILKKSLDDHMRRQGLWDDDKQKEYTELIKKSADIEYKIKSGKYKKASELRERAIELKKLRDEISQLVSVRNSMDSMTAEGLADNERFNFFVTVAVYDYETQKPVFSSLEEYIGGKNQELALTCAEKFANYMYGLDDKFEDNLIENKLLRKLNLVDEKGRLIDREGRWVDYDGNLVNEDGARIDENGERIDINNNPVINDDVIDSLEFEDDLSTQDEPEKKTTRRKKKETVDAS